MVHKIIKRLNDGLAPKYDPKLHANLPETGEVKTAIEFVKRTSEIQQNLLNEQEAPDLNKLVEKILSS